MKSNKEKILEKMIHLNNLKSMELCITTVKSRATPEMVSKLASKIEKFTLSTSGQNVGKDKKLLHAIVREIARNDNCNTKILRIKNQDGDFFTHVDPQLLGMAAAKLSAIEARDTGLTYGQAIILFEAATWPNSKLEKLKLYSALSHLKPELLCAAVKQLKELDLTRPAFTDEQKEEMFQTIQNEKINLEKLSLSWEFINSPLRLIKKNLVIN